MMNNPIRGKVARILNSRELVINVGTKDGVLVDMYFNILDPNGEDIKDPDSGELLGSVEKPKVSVKIINVQDNLSVASTYKRRKINIGGPGFLVPGVSLANLLMPPRYVTKYETLKTDEKTWEDLSEQESYVKIGDPVVQVTDRIDIEQDVSIE